MPHPNVAPHPSHPGAGPAATRTVAPSARTHRCPAPEKLQRRAAPAAFDPRPALPHAGLPAELLREDRGWSEAEWRAAAGRPADRGLLDRDGPPTAEGRALRTGIDDRTDALAVRPYRVLAPGEAERLLALLGRWADAVAGSGMVPFPNPMGLPPRGPGGGQRRVGR